MDTVFGLYVCQKSRYQPKIQHAICPCIGVQHISYLKILKKKDFGKSYIKISVFNFLESKNIFFWKIRDSTLKELLLLRHLVLFVCILLLISIFGDF